MKPLHPDAYNGTDQPVERPMTITLNLSDEQARRLRARAAQHRQSIEEYLLSLAEQEAEEWEALADELTQLIPDTVPPLPDEALRRETMYRE